MGGGGWESEGGKRVGREGNMKVVSNWKGIECGEVGVEDRGKVGGGVGGEEESGGDGGYMGGGEY